MKKVVIKIIEDSEKNIIECLNEQQIAYATDINKIIYRRADGELRYFDATNELIESIITSHERAVEKFTTDKT